MKNTLPNYICTIRNSIKMLRTSKFHVQALKGGREYQYEVHIYTEILKMYLQWNAKCSVKAFITRNLIILLLVNVNPVLPKTIEFLSICTSDTNVA